MKNFWKELPRPFLAQAPMEHVTDTVFRRIIYDAGKPDVFFTEFTNSEGLCSPGSSKVAQRLTYTEVERPLVAQIWGTAPEKFAQAAKIVTEMGFDGIDINMGCPDRTIVRHGCCSALINNHEMAAGIIQAVKRGVDGKIPVSVKTRIGFGTIQTEDWIGFLLEQDLPVLSVHLRTVKEKSLVAAHWEEMEKIVRLRDRIAPHTLIVGNGDIESREEAQEKAREYGCDGIMIGRGIFHNLWIFNKNIVKEKISKEQKIALLKEHITQFDATYQGKKDFNLMKKFYKVYINGWENAGDTRMKLMEFHNARDTLEYLKTIS